MCFLSTSKLNVYPLLILHRFVQHFVKEMLAINHTKAFLSLLNSNTVNITISSNIEASVMNSWRVHYAGVKFFGCERTACSSQNVKENKAEK